MEAVKQSHTAASPMNHSNYQQDRYSDAGNDTYVLVITNSCLVGLKVHSIGRKACLVLET